MPAKAGIQNYLKTLDSRLRGNDAKGRFKTFYENIKVEMLIRNRFTSYLKHQGAVLSGRKTRR
jgi:hypothetical protein